MLDSTTKIYQMPFETAIVIEALDFDKFVESVYKRPYRLHKSVDFFVKELEMCLVVKLPQVNFNLENEDFMDSEDGKWGIYNVDNGGRRDGGLPIRCHYGASFKTWSERDTEKPFDTQTHTATNKDHLDKFWKTYFYPAPLVLLNDLYQKGHLTAGNYIIRFSHLHNSNNF